jgi:hypothetical protein
MNSPSLLAALGPKYQYRLNSRTHGKVALTRSNTLEYRLNPNTIPHEPQYNTIPLEQPSKWSASRD